MHLVRFYTAGCRPMIVNNKECLPLLAGRPFFSRASNMSPKCPYLRGEVPQDIGISKYVGVQAGETGVMPEKTISARCRTFPRIGGHVAAHLVCSICLQGTSSISMLDVYVYGWTAILCVR